jgi:hypothetical protein
MAAGDVGDDVKDIETMKRHTRQSVRLTCAVLSAVACWFGEGCHAKSRKISDATLADEKAMLTKLRGYLDCVNHQSGPVFSAADTYREQVRNHAPNGATRIEISVPPDPATCLDAIAAAAKLEPHVPELETAAADFGRDLSSVYERSRSARDYYETANADYSSTKAIELNRALSAAYDAFDASQAVLFDRVFKLNRQYHLAQFARRAKTEKLGLPLLSEKVEIEGEALVQCAATGSRASLDACGFETHIATFAGLIEDYKSYADAHPDEAATADEVSSFIEGSRGLVLAAREMAHRLQNNLAYSPTENLMIESGDEAKVVGSLAAVIRAYNRMIETR